MSQLIGNLIALVATAVIVDGQRITVEPGQELPELSVHDAAELLDSGAAMDPRQQAATEKQQKQKEALALQSFREARLRAQAEQQSIATPEQTAPPVQESETQPPAKASAKSSKSKE